MTCDCGCGVVQHKNPRSVSNRRGLSTVAYRSGTFGSFRAAIVRELSRPGGLPGLRARGPEDHAISTVEMWCAVADVLTFYAERLVNEGYLRTATLPDSVRRLAALVDYLPARGTAATARLAFTLEDGAATMIPRGTRVASVPAEGETPQVYETLEDLAGDHRLNRLRVHPPPRPRVPTLSGATTAIVAGDPASVASAAALSRGDRVVLYSGTAIETLTVAEVATDEDAVQVSWDLPIGRDFPLAGAGETPSSRMYRLGRTFRPVGWDLPAEAPVLLAPTSTSPYPRPVVAKTDFTMHGDGTGKETIALEQRQPGLAAGAVLICVHAHAGTTTVIPLRVDAVEERHIERSAVYSAGPSTHVVRGGIATVVTVSGLDPTKTLEALGVTDIRSLAFLEAVGAPLHLWGYEFGERVATDVVCVAGIRRGWSAIEVGRTLKKGVVQPGVLLETADTQSGRDVFLSDAAGEPTHAKVAGATIVGSDVSIRGTAADPVTFDRLGLGPGRAVPATVLLSRQLRPSVTFTGARRELRVTIGALPPQTVALPTGVPGALAPLAAALQDAIRAALPGEPAFSRAIAAVVDSRILIAPGIPGMAVVVGACEADGTTADDLGLRDGHATWLDGVIAAPRVAGLSTISGTLEVRVGLERPVTKAINGGGASLAQLKSLLEQFIPEVRVILTPDERLLVLPAPNELQQRSFLRIDLGGGGVRPLDAGTAEMLGNVVAAGHGETVRDEVLGDGDASQPFQSFVLGKSPLTARLTDDGRVTSSLRLMVDGVEWRERRNLFGAGRDEHTFQTRVDSNGAVRITGGDSGMGAPFSTGRRNIIATYRKGVGLVGRVRAGQLSLLRDRPTGVKRVVNPLASDGGSDPEQVGAVRTAAPGSVRTFGRAVSLRDFEDGALTAGEVAKASANWVWTGERRAVHLTVAGQDGARFSPEGLARIHAALDKGRDPNHRLLVDNHLPIAVTIDATVQVGRLHRADTVLAASRAAVVGALSFERLRFGESITLSHIMAVLQAVDGVESVDVDVLDFARLAQAVRLEHGVGPNDPQPLDRLRILPARPAPTGTIILPAELARLEDPIRDLGLRTVGGLT